MLSQKQLVSSSYLTRNENCVFVRQFAQVKIVFYPLESGKLLVKSLLHDEKQDSRIRRGCSKQRGTAVLSFMHKSCINKQTKSLSHEAWATKPFERVHESVIRHQGSQPKGSHRAL